MISRRILAALALLCAVSVSAHAQPYTKAQLNAQVSANFPDQTAFQITPLNVRTILDNIINSIMPTAPVVGGNLACYNGTTGLLQDCGVAPSAASILYTAPGGTVRTVASKLFESTPSIVDWGGLGNNSQDNAAVYNTGYNNVISGTFGTGVPYTLTFPQGTFLFASKMTTDTLGINIIGVSKSQTGLQRNYNEATAINGIITRAQGGGQEANGCRLENLAVNAGTGTTGGSGVAFSGAGGLNGPDYCSMHNVTVTYAGTGAFSASGASLYIDGSAISTGAAGLRDTKLVNVELFSNGWPAAFLKSAVDFEWRGGNIAGLTTDVTTITGTTGVPSTNVNIDIGNMDALEIDHTNACHIHANAIQGAVTIDATTAGCFVESDQPIGGTITNNSTTSCIRSAKTWIGPSCLIIQGTSTNDSAAAGYVGEYVQSVVAVGSAVSLSSASPANITSISLTAGDWDVELVPSFTGGTTTLVANLNGAISLTTGTLDQSLGRFVGFTFQNQTVFNNMPGNVAGIGSVSVRMSLASTTTIFGVAQASFATSTCSAFGLLRARRVR